VLHVLVTANVVHNPSILLTLIKEVIHSSETPVLTRATRSYVQEDDILQYTKSFLDLIT
jgi:hypothetical protein